MVTVVPSSVRCDRLGDLAVDLGVEGDRAQRPGLVHEAAADGARERLAAVLGEDRDVLGELGLVAERLQDRHQVADRHGLRQERLQHALHLADGHQVGHQLVHRRRAGAP